MNSQWFDAWSMRLAQHRASRRDMLRLLGLAAAGVVGAVASVTSVLPARATGPMKAHRARHTTPADDPGAPFGLWPPDFPLAPPDEALNDYLDCIAAGGSHEDCDKGVPWCEIREYVLNRAFPHLTGLLEVANPFGEDCGTTDCLQCCYVPDNNGCHSSYIGENVINCRPDIYGIGTAPAGLTLLLQERPEDGTCLFTPQLCTHIGICMQGKQAAATAQPGARLTGNAVAADPVNYLIDPRAIKQRARVFAGYVLRQAQHYINDYATDTSEAPPLQSLYQAIYGRGWASCRQDLANLAIDLNDPLYRISDASGNTLEIATRANAQRTFAALRLLSGLPNVAGRLASVESRVWSDAEVQAYLAAVPDPDAALQETLDPHLVGILKRVTSLQDYRLLAVPLAGETPLTGVYGGMPLSDPPLLRLTSSMSGLTVTLTLNVTDTLDSAGGATRPVTIEWGDGSVTHSEVLAGQTALSLAHTYAVAGKRVIYAVLSNASGLRGAACTVINAELAAQQTQRTASSAPAITRVALTDLVAVDLPYSRDLRLSVSLVEPDGSTFLAGRSKQVTGPRNISLTADIGDIYAHNPARKATTALHIEPQHDVTAPHLNRPTQIKLSTVQLGVFSTAQSRIVDHPVALTTAMFSAYVGGSDTPLPTAVFTENSDGTISAPLLYRAGASGPWQRVARIVIALAPSLLDGLVLDSGPPSFAVGTTRAWVESRPGTFTEVPDIAPPDPTPVPPGPTQHKVLLPAVLR